MNVLERDTRDGGMKKAGMKGDRKKVDRRRDTAQHKRKEEKKTLVLFSLVTVHKFSLSLLF